MAREPIRLLNDASTDGALRTALDQAARAMHPPFDPEPGVAKLRARIETAAASSIKRPLAWMSGGVAVVLLTVGAATQMHPFASDGSLVRAPARSSPAATDSTAAATSDENESAPTAPIAAVAVAPTVSSPVRLPRVAPLPAARTKTASSGLPSPAPPPSSASESSDSEADEIAQLAELRAESRRDPRTTLTLAAEGHRRFPHGQLRQEREALAIEALVQLGRMDEARLRTERFDASFPRSPFGERLRSIVTTP